MRALSSASASARTHSAPARVLPAPRPPSTSQVVQSAPLPARAGGRWCSCAKVEKSHMNSSRLAAGNSAGSVTASSACSSALSSDKSSNAARKLFAEFVNIAGYGVVVGFIG